MKAWAKGGLTGFIAVFLGLWILLFIIGHDQIGWKCISFGETNYCEFVNFISSPVHLVFVLFFSWVGFFAGIIDTRIINKITQGRENESKFPLKVASVITLTLVIVFGIVGLLILENWVTIMIYTIIFLLFVLFVSWIVGKWKYG